MKIFTNEFEDILVSIIGTSTVTAIVLFVIWLVGVASL